jgi:hypothetical protein
MKILASINTRSPSCRSAKVIFQLFVFSDPAQRLPIERDRRPGALDSRDGLLDIARVSRAVLFDPCIDEDEQLLSFMFRQLLQLRNDYFLKSHGIPSKDLSFKEVMRPWSIEEISLQFGNKGAGIGGR